jgi:acyl-coenzyme A thioesterase PaaI-like protein
MARQRVGRFDFAAHNCFACGQLNLSGIQLDLHADDGRCWTELAIPRRFEGWDGIVHGGIVGAILDEVMAWSLIGEDRLGFTARLAIDFRRPVRVDQRVCAEGWIADLRRRRFATAARLVDAESGDVLAEATAVYVATSVSQDAALRERYDIRVVDEPA